MGKIICFDCKMEMDAADFERHELATCEEFQAANGRPFTSLAAERRLNQNKKEAIMPKTNKNPINMTVDDKTKEGLNDLAKRSGFTLYVLYEFIMADAVKNPPQIVKDAIEKRSLPEGLVEEMRSEYGLCPTCSAPGAQRERRPNGNDRCRNGHTYPSAQAIYHFMDSGE